MASTTKRGIISGGDDVEGGGDAESGMGPAAEGAGVTAEMVCVDAADLADVIGVHQEESAPEQVRSRAYCGWLQKPDGLLNLPLIEGVPTGGLLERVVYLPRRR